MTETPKTFPLPSKKKDVLDFLQTRRSNLAKAMAGPGPSEAELQTILEIGARVPDHRKLSPWRYVLFQGDARADFGKHIASAFMKDNPDMPLDRSLFESQRFLRAPLVIGVISSPVECARGTPIWEQHLSAGAVCFNLCLAAQAQGFAAQWLTEWYAYHDDVKAALGLSEAEQVAGFIYVGTAQMPSTERARPSLDAITSHWGE
jgi:nitroreductase